MHKKPLIIDVTKDKGGGHMNNYTPNNISSEITTPEVTTNASTDITDIMVSNLDRLKKKFNVTQKDLHELTGYSEAAISKYCTGTQYPTIDFLFKLKKEYDISIDDFVSREMFELLPDTDNNADKLRELTEFELYRKYCGNFLVYYLDTSNYKGRDNKTPEESLIYGIVNIHEVVTNLGKPAFKSFAILGIEEHKDAVRIKERLDSLASLEDITRFIYSPENKANQNNIYEGDFEFGTNHAYLTLKHGNVDKAFIVLYRISTNKDEFIGGLGVVSSSSKGRERMPASQFIGFSRYPLRLSAEEIHHQLLLSYPSLRGEKETKEIIKLFKHYYIDNDNGTDIFSDYQKELIMKVYIEDTMKKIIERNMYRSKKVSERDDSAWYQIIKNEKKKFDDTH